MKIINSTFIRSQQTNRWITGHFPVLCCQTLMAFAKFPSKSTVENKAMLTRKWQSLFPGYPKARSRLNRYELTVELPESGQEDWYRIHIISLSISQLFFQVNLNWIQPCLVRLHTAGLWTDNQCTIRRTLVNELMLDWSYFGYKWQCRSNSFA